MVKGVDEGEEVIVATEGTVEMGEEQQGKVSEGTDSSVTHSSICDGIQNL